MSAPAYRALRIERGGDGREHRHGLVEVTVDELSEGEVVIAPLYSAVNYKDAMAAMGTAPILRRDALIGGIDAAGTVVRSDDARFTIGQPVLATGCGLSETRDGGYAERLRAPADILIDIPPPLDARAAMILGTAGLTAMLAATRLRDNHLTPDRGPVLVTGASGGVGSVAVLLLKQLGYRVIAMTAKADAHEALRALGAEEVWAPARLPGPEPVLAHAEIAGAVDNLGGEALPAVARLVEPWGSVVSVGRATGERYAGSVMPFIIRGVAILGVSSANCPMARRRAAWTELAAALGEADLEPLVAEEVELDGLTPAFERLLAGDGRGRTLVRLNQYQHQH